MQPAPLSKSMLSACASHTIQASYIGIGSAYMLIFTHYAMLYVVLKILAYYAQCYAQCYAQEQEMKCVQRSENHNNYTL